MFQVKDLWKSQRLDNDDLNGSAFCVGDISNSKILHACTGSLRGRLRIWKLIATNDAKTEEPDDDRLELEMKFDDAIIALSIGKYVKTHQNNNYLAVLMNRKLVVFAADHASSSRLQLQQVYVHYLGHDGKHFTAHDMVSGLFGDKCENDSIVVQSLDGQMQVFEQETAVKLCTVGGSSLLPCGPLAYIKRFDMILYCTSGLEICAIRYHSLTTGGVATGTAPTKTPVWSFATGETVVGIFPGRFTENAPTTAVEILIVCERSMFILDDNGNPISNTKLDIGFHPVCCCLAVPTENQIPNIVLCSEKGIIHIYRSSTLIWSATCTYAPLAMVTATLNDIKGLMVMLGEHGEVLVSYLGVDRAKDLVGDQGNKRQRVTDSESYEMMDQQYEELLAKIRNLNTTRENESSVKREHKKPVQALEISCTIPETLDCLSRQDMALVRSEQNAQAYGYRHDGDIVQLTVKITIRNRASSKSPTKNVTVSLSVPSGIVPSETKFSVPQLDVSLSMDVAFRVSKSIVPSSLEVGVQVTFENDKTSGKSVESQFLLPLFLVCVPAAPIKTQNSMVNIEYPHELSRLSILFSDCLRQPGNDEKIVQATSSNPANVLGLQYFDGSVVTILASKTGGKYRIQADTMHHLWLILEQLLIRLSERDENCSCTCTDELPLHELFTAIEMYYIKHMEQQEYVSKLNDLSYQYRLTQKKLLSQYADRNSTSLDGMDQLLYLTHDAIMDTISAIQELDRVMDMLRSSLSACVQLVLKMTRLLFPHLDEDDMLVLSSMLSTDIGEHWMKQVDDAATHLLRTSLAKHPKAHVQESNNRREIIDAGKLKKHLYIVFDRIVKGGRPGFKILLESDDHSSKK